MREEQIEEVIKQKRKMRKTERRKVRVKRDEGEGDTEMKGSITYIQ